MFDARSRFSDFVDFCEDRIVARSDLKRGECPGVNWGRRQSYATLGDFVAALPGLSIDEFRTGWGAWLVKNMRDQVVRAHYRAFIDRARLDAMTAFSCYLYMQETDAAEDAALREGFEGKLPAAEKQLQRGEVTRRKAG